jgi:hypothetical protein
MAASRTYQRRRRPRTIGDGRSYGARPQGPRPERTGPSRQERADEALRSILDLFESDELPERIAETVIARAEGCSPSANWSLGNQLLMLLAGTTDARGFRQWKEVGRSVDKGAKAVYILGPVTRKIRETDETTGEESERPIVTGFTTIPVFRIEDTNGASVEPPDYRPAEFPPLYDVAQAWGIRVEYAPFVARFKGYYRPSTDRIMLCSHDARVYLHELAHAAHARVLRARGESLKGGQHAGQEIVAELTAAVLCRLYDLDGFLASSREYIADNSNGNPGRGAMRVLNDVQACLRLLLEDAPDDLGLTPQQVQAVAA